LKIAWAPFARLAVVQVVVLLVLEHEKGGPDSCTADPKVAFAGTVSVTTTFRAVSGPRFLTKILDVMLEPALKSDSEKLKAL
jgi:hypothetical protein